MEHRGYIVNGSREADVLGCVHCRRQMIIKPKKGCESVRLDRCGQCHGTICPPCAEQLTKVTKCTPFEVWLERIERRHRLLVAAGVEEKR